MLTLGLDFGTTNSAIGVNNGDKSTLLKLQESNLTDRTALFYSLEENEFVVGEEGIKRRIEGELGRLILSPKSFLNSANSIKTHIGSKEYNLEDIIGIIIKDFKERVENQIGNDIESVLIGRPVKFHDTNKKLDILAEERLKKAASLAGYKNIEFQYEPVAATKAYLNKNPLFRKGNIIIADLGGGTSDFSIVNVNEGKGNIIANNGIYIGGDLLDYRLSIGNFAKDLGYGGNYKSMGKNTTIPNNYYQNLSDWKNIHKIIEDKIKIKELLNKVQDKEKFQRLVEITDDISLAYEYYNLVKNFKEELTGNEKVEKDINIFQKDYKKSLTKTEFEDLIRGDIEKIGKTIKEALNQSGLKGKNIDKIIMTGGTSLIPLVRNTIENIIGKGKIIDSDTFTSVAYGLTLESYERFK